MGDLIPAEPMVVSNSEIQAFKRCRRKWWLQYVRKLGLKKEDPTGVRSIGNRVHAVLAEYYGGGADDGGALQLHDIDVWNACVANPDRQEDILKEADLSRAMLEGYFEWLQETGADEGLSVVSAEEGVEVVGRTPYSETIVAVRAKLDLRVHREHDDSEMFLDHKTVQEFTTPTRTLHLDEQMLMYDWLLEKVSGSRPAGAIYNMLRKVKRTARAKPPFFERFEVRHSPQEVQSFYQRLLGELEEMIQVRKRLQTDEDPLRIVYPSPNRNCSWDCDFFPVCPMIDRPQDKPEHFIEMLYEEVDPYQRYANAGVELS